MKVGKIPAGMDPIDAKKKDSVTRETITKEQMRKFLKFVHDDYVYSK